jgi:hypothetical protein
MDKKIATQQGSQNKTLEGLQVNTASAGLPALCPVQAKRPPLMEIRKSAHEVLRVDVHEYRGRNYVGLRAWYLDGASGEYLPSGRGISLRPECVAEVVQGLMLAAQASQTR